MAFGMGLVFRLIDMWYSQLIIIGIILIALKIIPNSIWKYITDWHNCSLVDCLIWQDIANWLGGFLSMGVMI